MCACSARSIEEEKMTTLCWHRRSHNGTWGSLKQCRDGYAWKHGAYYFVKGMVLICVQQRQRRLQSLFRLLHFCFGGLDVFLFFQGGQAVIEQWESEFCECSVGTHGLQGLLNLLKHLRCGVAIIAKLLSSNGLSTCAIANIGEKHVQVVGPQRDRIRRLEVCQNRSQQMRKGNEA